MISYPILTTLSDNDILQIVHTAASTLGAGYHHIYHVFLPKGVDECFVGTTQCYSPDNPSTFVFCAYHGSVTYSDIGHCSSPLSHTKTLLDAASFSQVQMVGSSTPPAVS
jgi:hypothetical protein